MTDADQTRLNPTNCPSNQSLLDRLTTPTAVVSPPGLLSEESSSMASFLCAHLIALSRPPPTQLSLVSTTSYKRLPNGSLSPGKYSSFTSACSSGVHLQACYLFSVPAQLNHGNTKPPFASPSILVLFSIIIVNPYPLSCLSLSISVYSSYRHSPVSTADALFPQSRLRLQRSFAYPAP